MKTIGKYQVIEELGESAAGNTYRVRDAFRNREFAAKVLHPIPGLSPEGKEQFCGHLASCAELTHRHIAKVHDLGEVEEGIFVATEWRSGMDLRRFIQENPDLPLDQKLAVIAQVAEGLAFAHSRGIAHGNLKPSNIFVDPARDVSILDFGIARWISALLAAGNRPEGLLANYLAPEQVLGQPFDTRSDIFALGLMLYEIASGKYPFAADPGLIPREIVHSEPEPLRTLDAQVPAELEQLVVRSLKKDPAGRLQTAEEFASGLYLAAQQLRRVASAAAGESPSAAQMPIEPIINHLPLALTPEPVIPQTAFAPAPELPALDVTTPQVTAQVNTPEGIAPQMLDVNTMPVAAPKVRERPQDAEPAAQPWTARSYSAGAPLPGANVGKPPAAPASVHQPPSPPAFQPPKSFLRPAALPKPIPVHPKISKMTKRVLTAAIGLILAAGIVGSLISRQNLRASQKNRSVAPASETVAPVEKPSSPPAPAAPIARVPKREDPAPEEVVSPEISAKQILNGPVRTLWESGRYAQALALVNRVLAQDPGDEDARSWKTKIREAQAAEAALK
jgi:serine/threonine protein kinase